MQSDDNGARLPGLMVIRQELLDGIHLGALWTFRSNPEIGRDQLEEVERRLNFRLSAK